MTDTNQLPERLRKAITEIRRKPYPISDLIPLLSAAADALQARAQVHGDPSWWMRETDEGAEWTDTAPLVLSGWTPLYTTLQPAQATQAEVTDAEIEALFGKCGGHWSGDQWVIEDADLHPFARTILALRPERVPMIARSLAEWHEDDGYAVWWAWNGDLRGWAGEPAYIGSPLCDDWPGYHTHWTAHPTQPIGITAQADLWCIHIPGPDEVHAAPSKEAADHMAAKHNAVMATYYASGAPNLEFAPSIENVQAVAIKWPHDQQSHADELREFDWAGWGIKPKEQA